MYLKAIDNIVDEKLCSIPMSGKHHTKIQINFKKGEKL